MGGLQTFLDTMWSYSPQAISSIARMLPTTKIGAILRYQSSFIRPGIPFRCWWARQPLPGNLGDLLTPLLIDRLFGLVPVYCPKRSFLGAGSVIQKSRPESVVWGSGLIAPDREDHPKTRYLAVRGPLTRSILTKRGREVPPIYGDPAILMPLIYQPKSRVSHAVGIIPHYSQISNFREVPKDATLIDVRVGTVDEIFDRIEQIASCEIIASFSLHGLILAISYERQFVWLRDRKTDLTGGTFKFEDFFASLGMDVTPIEISSDSLVVRNLESHAKSAVIPSALRDGLITAFCAWYSNCMGVGHELPPMPNYRRHSLARCVLQ